jgi:hypothetical protein
VIRALALLLALAAPAAAGDGTRLGTLIRWYLAEPVPARQVDLLEKIRKLADDDAARVAAAIRKGEHFFHEANPSFGKDGPAPVFHPQRLRIQRIAGAAGRYAELTVPEGYDPAIAHPLVVDLGAGALPVPEGAVRVQIEFHEHAQASAHALAAEGLVLSILARTFEAAHVDPWRVFLRAQGGPHVQLAAHIALNNPDRFAGLLGVQGDWRGLEPLARNSLMFSILAVESRKGDKVLRRLLGLDKRFARRHVLLRAPEKPSQDPELLPAMERWFEATQRSPNPGRIELTLNRAPATRAYWVRAAAKSRSLRRDALGRVWGHRTMNLPGSLRAHIDPEVKNLVHVEAHRILAFEIFVDPEMFDVDEPLRVSINGGVPQAKLIDERIDVLLEDYRVRRDPSLLYACRLSFNGAR